MWNVAYDSLLQMKMPDKTRSVGYADNMAVLVAARTIGLAQLKLNRETDICRWMAAHGIILSYGLSLALNKIEGVVLTKKRISTILPLHVSKHIDKTRGKMLGHYDRNENELFRSDTADHGEDCRRSHIPQQINFQCRDGQID